MKWAKDVLYSNELLLMTWELEQARILQSAYTAAHDVTVERRREAHHARQAVLRMPKRPFTYKRQYLDAESAG